MSMLSEQVKELRELADGYKMADRPLAANTIYQAADTIEVLSAKVAAKNMEQSADCGGWIPCKERLPEESGEYIATDECGISTALYYEREENRWVDIEEHYSIFYPTAWQPLPEPYHEP